MKQKTLYMLAIVCCMSFFSAAKQTGKQCDNISCCTKLKEKVVKPTKPKPKDQSGFDLSPLQIFVFGI